MLRPSMAIADAVQQYRAGYLPSRNLAPLTRRHYASDLAQLQRYLVDQRGLVTIAQVQPHHLDGYLAFLDTQGLKGSSRRRKLAAIRSLFRFLVQQRLLAQDVSAHLQPPQRERTERRVLTDVEYKRLLNAVQHEVRDGAIIELLLQTGIRQSECAAITLADVTLPARITRDPGNVGLLRVHGKGR